MKTLDAKYTVLNLPLCFFCKCTLKTSNTSYVKWAPKPKGLVAEKSQVALILKRQNLFLAAQCFLELKFFKGLRGI